MASPLHRRRWGAVARGWIGLVAGLAAGVLGQAQVIQFPTANRALLQADGAERFYVGTVGKPWTSGTFGCVRSEGGQFHEGLDIRCLQRDARGEPTDPILAAADGTVAYINTRPHLSNYGNYLILRHSIEGLEVCSLYAHLREVRPGLKAGTPVKAGETIAVMGRTSNTRQAISRERAHLHFELALFLNEGFPEWYRKTFPGQRNDHGLWNGQNLAGLDPQAVLLEQHRLGPRFRLLTHLQSQTELCRVQVRDTQFPWLKRYAPLVRPNPAAEKAGVAGYEIALNYAGLPFELIPRTAAELKSKSRLHLLSVNAAEQRQRPCKRLVVQRGGRWELGASGARLLELLLH